MGRNHLERIERNQLFLFTSFLCLAFLIIILNSCSKPKNKVVFENEYIRTYQNTTELKAWSPDWQEGEYWTINELRKNPIISSLNNDIELGGFLGIKYTVKDIKKYLKTKSNTLNLEESFLLEIYYFHEEEKNLKYSIFNKSDYIFMESGSLLSETLKKERNNKQLPAYNNNYYPVCLPVFPIDLTEDSSIVYTKSILTKELSKEESNEIEELKIKKKILKGDYSLKNKKKFMELYPNYFNLDEEERNEEINRISKRINEIWDKYPPVEKEFDYLKQKVIIINTKKFFYFLSKINIKDEFLIFESNLNNENSKGNNLKKDFFINNIKEEISQLKNNNQLGLIFQIDFYYIQEENKPDILFHSQIWSTSQNWPIISIDYDSDKTIMKLSYLYKIY